jgi:glycoprotein 6-alpha-L-fucosyltransferase
MAFLDIDQDKKVLVLPSTTDMFLRPSKSKKWPIVIPIDLHQRLTKLLDDPFAWWMGQFEKYYFKPTPKFEQMVSNIPKQLKFKRSMVGVHVRRAEKIAYKESKFVALEVYMEHVNEYYEQLELSKKNIEREVLLLTDDPKVLTEARQKYPKYKFITNNKSAELVQSEGKRYGEEYLALTTADLEMLSKCDYVVLTFSSNFGRRVLELMFNYHMDAVDRIVSVDHMYYNWAYPKRLFKVVVRHSNATRSLNVGDIVFLTEGKKANSGSEDGLLQVTKDNNNASEWIPEFKLEQVFSEIDTPSYNHGK